MHIIMFKILDLLGRMTSDPKFTVPFLLIGVPILVFVIAIFIEHKFEVDENMYFLNIPIFLFTVVCMVETLGVLGYI